MSLTQERINEIALECWDYYLANSSLFTITDMFNHFLSRLRDEQEAAVVTDDNPPFPETSVINKYLPIGTKLFTIPPAAPDCNQIISAFSGDEVPSFRQGAPSHELEYAVTAEDCSRWVNELIELRDVCKELVDALELLKAGYKIDGGIFKRDFKIVQEALTKHKASMGL